MKAVMKYLVKVSCRDTAPNSCGVIFSIAYPANRGFSFSVKMPLFTANSLSLTALQTGVDFWGRDTLHWVADAFLK